MKNFDDFVSSLNNGGYDDIADSVNNAYTTLQEEGVTELSKHALATICSNVTIEILRMYHSWLNEQH